MDVKREGSAAATRLHVVNDHGYAQPEPGPMDVVRVGRLQDATCCAPEFVVEPIIPRAQVTLLSGHGGVGKSMLALIIAAHTACGTPWGPFRINEGRVLFVTLEDSARLVRYRLSLIVAAYKLDQVALDQHFVILDGSTAGMPLVDEVRLSEGQGLLVTTAYSQTARSSHGFDLVVIDNASEAYEANTIDNRLVRKFVRNHLGRIARDNQLAVLLLAHVDKDAARNGSRGQSYLGSVAWHNSSRSRIALIEQSTGLVLEHEKYNLTARHDAVHLFRTSDGVPMPGTGDQQTDNAENIATLTADATAILAAMTAAEAIGLTIHTGSSGQYSPQAALSTLSEFPHALRGRGGRTRFWAAFRHCQSSGAIRQEEYVTSHRNRRTRFVLMKKSSGSAAVLQSP